MTDERFEKIEQSIMDAFVYNEEYCGIEDAKKIISKIIGKDCCCYDSYIDDGCDDADDDYVMCDAFECGELTIRVYYGNNTYLIGCVDVRIED